MRRRDAGGINYEGGLLCSSVPKDGVDDEGCRLNFINVSLRFYYKYLHNNRGTPV